MINAVVKVSKHIIGVLNMKASGLMVEKVAKVL